MHPILSVILKQLPHLLPIVESLLKKRPSVNQDNGRLVAVEQSVELLAERSDYLEAKLKRVLLFVVIVFFLSLAALILALAR